MNVNLYLESYKIKYNCDLYSKIDMDVIMNNITVNTVFAYLFKLIIKNNFNIFQKRNNLLYFKNKNEFIDEFNIHTKNIIDLTASYIKKLYNNIDEDWVDIKTKVDKITNNLNDILKELYIIKDLCINVFIDNIFEDMFYKKTQLCTKIIIEEFTN